MRLLPFISDITESNAPNRRNSFSPEPSGTSAALMDMLRTREGSGDATEKYPSLRDLGKFIIFLNVQRFEHAHGFFVLKTVELFATQLHPSLNDSF